MLEIFTTYPLLTVLIIAVVIWLIKSHIVASHDEVADLKENIIKSLKDGKCFVTPDELGQAKTEVKTDIENRFLTLAAFAEFKSGIDNQFKTVFHRFDEGTEQFKEVNRGINDIKNYLLKQKRGNE